MSAMSEIEEQGASVEDRGQRIEEERREEEAPRESRSIPPIVKLLILVAGVAAMVAGAYFLTKLVILPQVKDVPAVERLVTSARERVQRSREEREEEERERGPVITHSIDNIVANIGGRILMLGVIVETTSEDARDEMVEREYQIRDALLFFFRGRTLNEISTTEFMNTARDTIRSIINSIIEDEPVDTVFFTDYFIQ